MIRNLFIFLLTVPILCACKAQDTTTSHPLAGLWLAEVHSDDIGVARTVLTFEGEDGTFSAHSRRGAAADILGFWKSALARVFTDDFKGGSLLRITDGIVQKENDTTHIAGILRWAIGDRYVNGHVEDDTLHVLLRDADKRIKGLIVAHRIEGAPWPLREYPAVISAALDTTRARIYSRKILQTKEWKRFEKNMTEVGGEVMDDLELVFAFFHFAGELPISHYALTRIEPTDDHPDREPKSHLTLEPVTGRTAVLTISSFSGSAGEVDSVFAAIATGGYDTLIVDLRDNPGGSVEAGMAFARHVFLQPMTGGVFLTQKWFDHHDSLPTKSQYATLPRFSHANYDLIIGGIHRERALVLEVKPVAEPYRGELYILTNGRTASTGEPLVYALKSSGRATVVGRTTAGAMLNGEEFDLPAGFSLFVPTADYYTADGYRIDQNGVEPDLVIGEGEDALQQVLGHSK